MSFETALLLVGGWDLLMIGATLVAMLVAARTVPLRSGPRWAAFVVVDGVPLFFVVVAIAALVVWPVELGLSGVDTGVLLALAIAPYGLLAPVILLGLVILPLRAAGQRCVGGKPSATVRR